MGAKVFEDLIEEKSVPVSLAKPSREMVYSFGKGELPIAGSTMDFLMYLSPYIDLDGRVIIPLEQARYDLLMQSNTYNLVLREVIAHGLLVQKGNHYYSKFHIHTNGSSHEFNYIKLLAAYTSATVRGYSLRSKRLFYYFASWGWMATWKRISIEHLYQNKIQDDSKGIQYFDNFKQVSQALLDLVKDGLIEIKLPTGKSELLLDSNTCDLENQFYQHFNFEEDERKKRTSHLKSVLHVLKIRISPTIAQQDIRVAASEKEFIQLAQAEHIAWDELQQDTVKYVISYKNTLYQVAGDTGLAIYRRSIQAFLKEFGDRVLHYDALDKMANYFMDFYLLPEIKRVLVDVAYHQKWMKSGLLSASLYKTESTRIIACNTYQLNFNVIKGLLSFYQDKGSINHIICLDGDLLEHDIEYDDILIDRSAWLQIAKLANKEYEIQRNTFKNEDPIDRPIYQNPVEWKRFMIECAKEGMFVKQQAFVDLIKQLQIKETPIANPYVKEVPFYNWLEHRA